MRIAGRDNTGLAKPIKVDENGGLRSDGDNTLFAQEIPIFNAGETLNFVFPNRKHPHVMVGYSAISHGFEGSTTQGIPKTSAVNIDLYSRIDQSTSNGSVKGSNIYRYVEMEYSGLYERGLTSVESMLALHEYIHVSIKNTLDVPINQFSFVVAGLDVPIKKEEDKRRVVELGRVIHETVQSGTNKLFLELDVSDFPIQTCVVRADTDHDFKVDFLYRPDSPVYDFFGGGALHTPITVMEGTLTRGTSDWISAQSGTLRVIIHNNSDIEHEYDLVVTGVR